MSTKAIKRKRDDKSPRDRDWEAHSERAPSIIRDEQFAPMRVVAMIALVMATVGGLALMMAAFGRASMVTPGWGIFLLMAGVSGLLLHAFGEKEEIYRRIYGLLSTGLLVVGVLFSLLKGSLATGIEPSVGGMFLPIGAPALALGLLFGVSFSRNEDDEFLKMLAMRVVGAAGGLLVAVGFLGGIISDAFLLQRGVVYLILGLFYVTAFIGMTGMGSDQRYWTGLAVGAVGAVMLLIALGKALPFGNIPWLGPWLEWINDVFIWVRWPSGNPALPFVFAYMGIEYLLLAIGICSDSQLVAITRRELAAYFYSPIAYIVLIALVGMAFIRFAEFSTDLFTITQRNPSGIGVPEPIFIYYVVSIIPVICAILMVPVITMRQFSEESRSGTMEVLLTAPVKESTVVIAKFIAALRFYMLAWYSWGLFLVALFFEQGAAESFDYRPAMSFVIVLLVTGAGFIGMGMFFSSLTRNQITAAVLGFLGMIALLAIFFIPERISQTSPFWADLLEYFSFLHLWIESSRGFLSPRYLLLHISAAVFWLFLTTKVLESRKWR